MATEVRLKHEASGMIEKAVIGFSWTSLFFGIFVPLLRGDWKWVFMGLIITIITAGFGWFLIAFIYNKSFVKSLLLKGYKPADEESKQALISGGIPFAA
jgi:hypothetical protein